MLQTGIRAWRANRGFSMIEMIVVLAIIGTLLLVGANFMTAMFNTTGQANESMAKVNAMQTSMDWVRRELIAAEHVGILNSAGTAINPLSVASDQLVFVDHTRAKDACVRIFYQQSTEQLRAQIYTPQSATSRPCSAAAGFVLRRGPNQDPPATPARTCSDPLFDPAIDLAPGASATCDQNGLNGTYTGAFVLVSNVNAQRPPLAASGMPDPLRMFMFLGLDKQPLGDNGAAGPVQTASTDATGAWYATPSNLRKIGSVRLTEYVDGTGTTPLTATSAKQIDIVVGGTAVAGANPSAGNEASLPDTVLAYNTAAQYIPSGTYNCGPMQVLALNSERVDTAGMHATSGDTSKVSINSPGLYIVDAAFTLTDNVVNRGGIGSATGTGVMGYLLKNGSVIASAPVMYGTNTWSLGGVAVDVQAGDYFQIGVLTGATGSSGQAGTYPIMCTPEGWWHDTFPADWASYYVSGGTIGSPSVTRLGGAAMELNKALNRPVVLVCVLLAIVAVLAALTITSDKPDRQQYFSVPVTEQQGGPVTEPAASDPPASVASDAGANPASKPTATSKDPGGAKPSDDHSDRSRRGQALPVAKQLTPAQAARQTRRQRRASSPDSAAPIPKHAPRRTPIGPETIYTGRP